ncbi:MAG: DUF72 domain-containing protein [Thermodesulfobacteriota bacterium]
MAKIFIGTSGFSYHDWRKVFYPDRLAGSDFLSFYAQEFPAVELNFSYYRIPEPDQCLRMLEKSAYRTEFVVKAFQGITHECSKESLSEIVPKFKASIDPFWQQGRLGAVLLQFPQSFHYRTESRIYLKSLIERFDPLPLCVEFRQQEWMKDSVFSTLKELRVGFVCVDEPALRGLLPPLAKTTSSIGYIRFHGRNKSKWYTGDTKARYDYLYSEDELKEWIPRISAIAKNTERLFIFFNNHKKGQAVANAKMLRNLLNEHQNYEVV